MSGAGLELTSPITASSAVMPRPRGARRALDVGEARHRPEERVVLGARHRRAAAGRRRIARKLAQLIYLMLRYGPDYVDIGEKTYEAQFEARRLASLQEAARGLGYTLVQEPLADG